MGSSPTIDRIVFISQNRAIALISNCSASIDLIIGFTSTVGELILRSASRLKQKIFYGKTRGLGLQQLPDHTGHITGIKWLYRIKNLSFLLLL